MPPDNVEVTWEVASDDQMRRVVQSGRAVARLDFAHSLQVEVNGLEPARWYHYRFRAGGVTSPIGRTRTAPAPGAPGPRLNFAFVSCQHFERGLYTADQHLVNEDIELVVFLGDSSHPMAGGSVSSRRAACTRCCWTAGPLRRKALSLGHGRRLCHPDRGAGAHGSIASGAMGPLPHDGVLP